MATSNYNAVAIRDTTICETKDLALINESLDREVGSVIGWSATCESDGSDIRYLPIVLFDGDSAAKIIDDPLGKYSVRYRRGDF